MKSLVVAIACAFSCASLGAASLGDSDCPRFLTLPMLSSFAKENPLWVRYLRTDAQREKYRLRVRDGLVLSEDGKPFTTTPSPAGRVIYRLASLFTGMTYDGVWDFVVPLVAAGEPDDTLYAYRRGTLRHHHSTLCAGGPVRMAGWFVVRQGKIVSVGNRSGHYCPTLYSIYRFYEWLEARGVSLDAVWNYRFSDEYTPYKIERVTELPWKVALALVDAFWAADGERFSLAAGAAREYAATTRAWRRIAEVDWHFTDGLEGHFKEEAQRLGADVAVQRLRYRMAIAEAADPEFATVARRPFERYLGEARGANDGG